MAARKDKHSAELTALTTVIPMVVRTASMKAELKA